MTNEDIIQKIKDNKHDRIRVAVSDIDGILRGKLMHKEKFLSSIEGSFGFCSVVFGWDMQDSAYDNSKFTGWHTGYPDSEATIDLSTYREIPWLDNMPFVLADFSRKEEDLAICPRVVLKRTLKKAQDMGFDPSFSQEFEWFNFVNSEYNTVRNVKEEQPLSTGMFGYSVLRTSQHSEFFNDLFDLCASFDIPLEGLHTETGPGVLEAAIKYSDIILAADRAILFKTAVKEIASFHGIQPTFMAKPSHDLPGCSGHIHQSLWKEGKNVFYDKDGDRGMSEIMQYYMAGQMACLPYILPLFAPTINSYKRLVEGAWAPTTLTWAVDNRTTALRALPGSKTSTRLESRVIGSDVNPYLAMAGCLASGLYGIENKLELTAKETKGNGYEDAQNGRLPSSLENATAAMKKSDIPNKLFSEQFVDHFIRTREWECRQFASTVTDWEIKRYMETV